MISEPFKIMHSISDPGKFAALLVTKSLKINQTFIVVGNLTVRNSNC